MLADDLPRVPYTDPWAEPFDVRRRALLAGRPRVAYYYTVPDTSTFRYRAFNMGGEPAEYLFGVAPLYRPA